MILVISTQCITSNRLFILCILIDHEVEYHGSQFFHNAVFARIVDFVSVLVDSQFQCCYEESLYGKLVHVADTLYCHLLLLDVEGIEIHSMDIKHYMLNFSIVYLLLAC